MSSDTPIFKSNEKVINAQSMVADLFSSSVTEIAETPLYCVHAIWTGSPVGNILVEASNDAINFVPVASCAAGGSSGQYLLNVERAGYKYVRAHYQFTSGTGTLTTYLSTKTI